MDLRRRRTLRGWLSICHSTRNHALRHGRIRGGGRRFRDTLWVAILFLSGVIRCFVDGRDDWGNCVMNNGEVPELPFKGWGVHIDGGYRSLHQQTPETDNDHISPFTYRKITSTGLSPTGRPPSHAVKLPASRTPHMICSRQSRRGNIRHQWRCGKSSAQAETRDLSL